MDVYFNGILISTKQKKFTGRTGDNVEYYENFLKSEAGDVIRVNSQSDFTRYVDKAATIRLTLRQDVLKPSLYKPSLSAIEPLPVEGGNDRTIT